MSDWQEVDMKHLDTPEGYAGNLTTEHEAKLREMWAAFFDCCDRASGTATKGVGVAGELDNAEVSKDVTKSGIPQDDAAKEDAKKAMEEAGMRDLLATYGSDALKDTFWRFCKGDNPDTTLLRFLRARKWEVPRAMAMLATCLKWRLDSGVEELAEKGDEGNSKDIPKWYEQNSAAKIYLRGCNALEQPVCYVHLKKHFTNGQPTATMQKYIIAQMETWRLFMVPPQDKVTIVFDLAGFGLRNMDFGSLFYVVKCLEAYYPESLGTMFIHRGPWIFFQAWKVVKGLLDPVVRSKVAITQKLEEVTPNVPADRLVEPIGGDVVNLFEWIAPEAGENDKLLDTATRERLMGIHSKLAAEYERITRQWTSARGSAQDAELTEQRRILVKKLRVSQFGLEPYTRGVTIHHRNGTLVAGNPGIVRWEYVLKNGEHIRQIVGRTAAQKSLWRELSEISQGSSVDEAEAKTARLIESGEWGPWDTCDDLGEEVIARAQSYARQPSAAALPPTSNGVQPEAAPAAAPQPVAQPNGDSHAHAEAPIVSGQPAAEPAAAAAAPAPAAKPLTNGHPASAPTQAPATAQTRTSAPAKKSSAPAPVSDYSSEKAGGGGGGLFGSIKRLSRRA